MALWLLVGCGDVTNDVFRDDSAFVAAVPDPARLALDLPWSVAADGTPDLLATSVTVADGVSAALATALDARGALVATSPSSRADDVRTWGPFGYLSGWVTAEVARGTDAWSWSFVGDTLAFDAAAPYLQGEHHDAGDGAFAWDHAAWAALAETSGAGAVGVTYDLADGTDLLVEVDGLSFDGGEAASGRYAWWAGEHDGDLQYRYDTVVAETGDAVTVAVRLRWVPGGGGRADAWVDGMVGQVRDPRWTQCWDASGALTFEEVTTAPEAVTGDVAACPFAEPATADRL